MELHSDSIKSPFDQSELAPARSVRMRVGLGAGVVLILVAAAVAVVVSAVSAHPAAASTATYSTGESASSTAAAPAAGSAAEQANQSDGAATSTADASAAFVQVVGQVQKPGLYELPAGDRIVDAVAAAGGFTAKADQASLNLAQVISDGQQIVVGVKGAAPVTTGSISGVAGSGTVDINTADATTLETLDGIGPALAQRILAYRTAHGGFRSVGDLQNVTGIGPKKFAAIKGSVST